MILGLLRCLRIQRLKFFMSYFQLGANISTWTNNFVDQSIGVHLTKFTKAKEVWDYLSNLYVQSNFAKRYQLRRKQIQVSVCDWSSAFIAFQVSKEQHQLVRSSMKNSSNSIQSRSLNHVLGNLYTFHVQPFEVFEKEERKKLHEHWLVVCIKH